MPAPLGPRRSIDLLHNKPTSALLSERVPLETTFLTGRVDRVSLRPQRWRKTYLNFEPKCYPSTSSGSNISAVTLILQKVSGFSPMRGHENQRRGRGERGAKRERNRAAEPLAHISEDDAPGQERQARGGVIDAECG